MKYENEIRQFIADKFFWGQNKKFGSDMSLIDAGIVDSTGVLEIVSFLEENFGITVKDDELVPENLDSIARICIFLGKKHGF